MTYIQFLHSMSSRVGALEVDKSTEPLVQHTDTLDISTPATQANNSGVGCINRNVLLPKAVLDTLHWNRFIRFKKVPKVFLRQLGCHISDPQRSAGASEDNKSITPVKNN